MSQAFVYPSAGGGGGGAGDASASNQLLQLAQETTTATQTTALNSKTPTVGQKTMAASSPVVLSSDQSSIPVSATIVGTVPVSGSGTFAVSAAALPLPSGAATETTLSAASAKLPATLGQKAMAASLAVTLSSDQSAIPVTTTVSDVTASGAITTQNLVPAGVATAGSAVASGTLNGAATASIQVTGTYTGALSLQYTVDGTNWITAGGTPFLNVNTGTWLATITSALAGIFQIETTAMPQFRITALAAVTGTATVTLRTSRAAAIMAIDASLPAGAAVIGALVANQSVNAAQINGVAPLMGAGPTGTGSLRTTVSNVATATLANVASAAVTTAILASAAARIGASFQNESSATLYLKYGATASLTSYTVAIPPGGYFELPQPCYSGAIDGIWSAANGTCRVTSW